jgi:hypothetical protein
MKKFDIDIDIDIDIAPDFMYLLTLLHAISSRGQTDQKLGGKRRRMKRAISKMNGSMGPLVPTYQGIWGRHNGQLIGGNNRVGYFVIPAKAGIRAPENTGSLCLREGQQDGLQPAHK